jgi:hypothetical protein
MNEKCGGISLCFNLPQLAGQLTFDPEAGTYKRICQDAGRMPALQYLLAFPRYIIVLRT